MTPEEKYQLMMAVLKEMQTIRMFGAFEMKYVAEDGTVAFFYQGQHMGYIDEKSLRAMAKTFGEEDLRTMQEVMRARKALLN